VKRAQGVAKLACVCIRGQHASGTTLLRPAQHTHHLKGRGLML
jgi:hypothetical protein